MDILERLKRKRKEIAEREGKELFMVFHNKTLEDTAIAKPKNLEELTLIKGWGKKKIEKYGKEFISLINNNDDNSGPESAPSFKNNPVRNLVNEKIFEVSEFMEFVNGIVSNIGTVKIKGELSEINFRQGNCYFKLKDSSGRDYLVNCLMWRWEVDYWNHLLEDGLEVVVKGIPGIYKKGSFNVTVKSMEPIGAGALKKAFEALKKKLADKGYFDESRKIPIPQFVKKIGLITSETGEAINDFRRNLGEYNFDIYFFDARVEGDYAESSIIKALKWFNLNEPHLDALVLIRGGGSLESLQAFNSEKIVEAIITSKIPVLSGIGHEGDETIVDFVSDKRCSTPTAVAQFLKNSRENLIRHVGDLEFDLSTGVETYFRFAKEKTKNLIESLSSCLNIIFNKFSNLKFTLNRLILSHENRLQTLRHGLEVYENRLLVVWDKKIVFLKNIIQNLENSLLPLNPESVLERGFSIARLKNGAVIKSVRDAGENDKFDLTLKDGSLTSVILEIKPENRL